tara:strand:+ start:518 stop:1291 length:774 start_codon:yes stop_codon:yes gene_type:complete
MPNANVTQWTAKTALPVAETPKTLDGLLDAGRVVDASGALSYRAAALFLAGLWESVKPTSDKVPFCRSPEFVKGTALKDGFRSERSFFRYLAKNTGRTEDAVKQDALRAKALFGQSIVTDDDKVTVYRMAFSLDGVLELCGRNDWILKNAAKKAIQCYRKDKALALEMFAEIAEVDASDAKEMAEIVKDYFPPTAKTSKGNKDDAAGQVVGKDVSVEDVATEAIKHLDKATYEMAVKVVSLLSDSDKKKLKTEINKK